MMINSKSRKVCARMLSIASARNRSTLHTTMTTETMGLFISSGTSHEVEMLSSFRFNSQYSPRCILDIDGRKSSGVLEITERRILTVEEKRRVRRVPKHIAGQLHTPFPGAVNHAYSVPRQQTASAAHHPDGQATGAALRCDMNGIGKARWPRVEHVQQ